MDGRFVPNITLGPLIVAAIHRATSLPLDVHLMIDDPLQQIDAFAAAGAAILTVHAEATRHLHRVIQAIKRAGVRAGAAINPATPTVMLEEILPELDLALVMSVNPGWGGQPFIPLALEKLRRLRCQLDERGLTAELEVDGGIGPETAQQAVEAGATVLVAGSAVYNDHSSVASNLQRLRELVSSANSPRRDTPRT
jgi:ribulose-phosphate 3-epimerase